MQCQQNRRLVTLKISNLKSSRNLWWVVNFNNCCLNCDWPCNYPFSFSGRLALLSRKKGIKRGICSEVLRGVSLKVMKVMLTCFILFFHTAECTAKLGHIHIRAKKASWLFFCLAGSWKSSDFSFITHSEAGVAGCGGGPSSKQTCALL